MPKRKQTSTIVVRSRKHASLDHPDDALSEEALPCLSVEESDTDLAWDEWDRACILQDIALDVSPGTKDYLMH